MQGATMLRPQPDMKVQLGVDVLWDGPLPAVPGLALRAVTGRAAERLAALAEGAILILPHPTAREAIADALDRGQGADLDGWAAATRAVLRIAAGGRLVAVSPRAMATDPVAVLRAAAGKAAGIRNSIGGDPGGGRAATPCPAPMDAGAVMAELVLAARPDLRRLEVRLARAMPGAAPPLTPAALAAACGRTLAGIADLHQQLAERQTELAERHLTEAATLTLMRDQMAAARASAGQAYADLLDRLGDTPSPGRAALLRERDAARAERDAVAARLEAVLASTAWRATGPLRRALDRLRRYRMKSPRSI